MEFFVCVPALMILFFISFFVGTTNYCLKKSHGYSWEVRTMSDKVWFVFNLVVLSCFF